MVHWTAILACGYLGFELFLLATRRGKVEAKPADRGTIYVAWALILGGCFSGFLLARQVPVLNWPVTSPIVCLAGFLLVGGIALRIWAIRHLGRFFTVDVGIQQGHRLVEDGPYRFVRHPSYSGSLAAQLAWALPDHHLHIGGIRLACYGRRKGYARTLRSTVRRVRWPHKAVDSLDLLRACGFMRGFFHANARNRSGVQA